ncbi:DEAD-box ATP-dependent RNA helicase 38, partial [Tanacetum coccineum]
MGKHSPITCVLGLPPSKKDYTPLAKKLPVEAQVIIGTPVTIHKWIVAQKLVLDGVGMLLIDDVDHLLAE